MKKLIYLLLIFIPLFSTAQLVPPADFSRYAQNGGGGGGGYTLPVATSSTLGGVKKGSGLAIAGDGTVSSQIALFNVIDYGAVHDGTTNCTSAIQSAINAAHTSGGTVYLPAGVYLVDTLKSYPNVLIRGESRNNTVLKAHSANTILTMVVTTGTYMLNGVFVQELQFDGNSTGTRAIYLKLFARAQIISCYIHDFTTTGIYNDGTLVASFLYCTISNCGTGVYMTAAFSNDANLNSFYDCQIVSNATWGVEWVGGAMVTMNMCDFEVNGTTSNSSTGAIYGHNIAPASEGIGLTMNQCWFEQNKGTDVKITSSNPNINTFNNCFFLGGSGNVYAIQIIGSTTVGVFNGISIQNSSWTNGIVVDAATVYAKNLNQSGNTNSIINSGNLLTDGQVLNDVEILTSGKGLILKDTGDGTRRRITVNNGSLVVSSPL